MMLVNKQYYQPQFSTQTPTNARKVIENYSYGLQDQIGKGFSSIVYKGRNDQTQELVAIKVIDKKGLKTPLHYQLLKSEIEALSQLNATNIMKLYKVFYTENNTYLITEFCEGGDLSVNKPLKEAQLQKLFAGIMAGYKQMKLRGVVHRDLKPANILLKNGVPKIADLGFATTPETVKTMPNVNVGSPLYMSPQAFKNRYSEKSDIWALGVSLFELAFGVVPWQAGSEKELAQRIATVPVQFPFQVSDELKDFIQRCLVVDEHKRASIEDLERHSWLRQQPQLIKAKAFAQKEATQTQSPLNDAQNKIANILNSQHYHQGKENLTSTAQKGREQFVFPTPAAYKVRQSRNESQVNTSFEEQKNYQSGQQFQLSLQLDITPEEIKKNDYIVLAQINYCRYLYRVGALIDKYQFQQKQLRERLLFLVTKNIMIKIHKLKEMISGQNSLNLAKFNAYMLTQSFSKLCSAIQQYHQKYSLQFNQIWIQIQGMQVNDKKFDAVFDDNLVEYESYYIILNSILRNAIQEINSVLQIQVNGPDQSLLPFDVEAGVILLDYLITYFQLTCLIQDSFDDYYSFAVDSKIEQIADGKPVRLTYGHYNEIKNKIQQLDI